MMYLLVFVANICAALFFLISMESFAWANLLVPALFLLSAILSVKAYLTIQNLKEGISSCLDLLGKIGNNILHLNQSGALTRQDGWRDMIENVNQFAAKLQSLGELELKTHKITIKKKA